MGQVELVGWQSDDLGYLFGLEQFGIKFGLDNIAALVETLGHPEHAFPIVHIAGTNGKGSVTAMVDAALRAAGHRSARYTSPHLVRVHERFVIDGAPVTTEALVASIARLRGSVDALLTAGILQAQPTFFEATTAIALDLFRRANVDVAILEVGLGGRLDATNIVTPTAAAITSIAFDHEKYLGRTLADIAREKAGIIKPGIPVVVGRTPPEPAAVIDAIATASQSPIVWAWDGVSADSDDAGRIRLKTPAADYGVISLGLRGAHQVDNAVVAVRLLEVLNRCGIASNPESIREGLSTVSWPGRLDIRQMPGGRELILDAAHNPAGAAALASYLRDMRRKLPLVFAAMRDKDVDRMFRALLPTVGALVLTRASNPRSADPDALAGCARRLAPDLPIRVEPILSSALEAAWESAPTIIVAGSIFLLGDVMGRLDG